MESKPIKGILFDLDGTLVDVPYDWDSIRRELDTGGKPILSFISSLPESQRSQKWKILEEFEKEATAQAVLKPGVRDLLDLVSARNVKTALISNNSRRNVDILLERFYLGFDLVMARETGLWKPSGEPFRYALARLKLESEECCAIGDSLFDIMAAQDVGIQNIFILSEDPSCFADTTAEVFTSVKDLLKRIRPLLD